MKDVTPVMVVNDHVEMLNAFQPFDADFAEIYLENRSNIELRIDTLAGRAVRHLLDDAELRALILTGDAGHGKTHLCAELLADVRKVDLGDAVALLRGNGQGNQDLAVLPDGRSLRVIRDLSEFSDIAGNRLLSEALSRSERVTVICANEGRLRAASKGLPAVFDLLQKSLLEGRIRSDDRAIAVLNLNHQSVVAENREDPNILRQVLRAWIEDSAKWTACDDCESKIGCPILKNRSVLGGTGEAGEGSRLVLETLLKVVERTGHVLTIRELLIFVSHLVTGGLRCRDVHRRALSGESNWQWRFMHHQVCFGDLVPPELASSLEIFRGLRLLDPARRSLRLVDDQLDLPQADSIFDPLVHDTLQRVPKNAKEQREQAEQHLKLWRYLRRKDFFGKSGLTSDDVVSTSERVGLRHQHAFMQVMAGGLSQKDLHRIRAGVIRGLEALQGLHRGQSLGLRLVDPAVVGPQSEATAADLGIERTAIVARQIGAATIQLLPESAAWRRRGSAQSVEVLDHIDWLERKAIISLGGADAPAESSIELMMHEFELLISAGEGMRSATFFEPEIRRILRRLGTLAVVGEQTDEILLVKGGNSYRLLLAEAVLVGGQL